MIFFKNENHTEQKHLNFSYSIKQNLSVINQNLSQELKKYKPSEEDEFSFLDDSEIMDSENDEQKRLKENLKLLQDLLENWEENQTKSILIYNRLIKRPLLNLSKEHPIFINTIFHKNLWPLMTYYLENQLNYHSIKRENSKVIDVWYQFITCENNELFSIIVSQNLIENIGNWFKTYCLEELFVSFSSNDKKLFTIFIKDFFLYGLAFLFYESVNVLRKNYCPLKENFTKSEKNLKFEKINHIQVNYIEKFKL